MGILDVIWIHNIIMYFFAVILMVGALAVVVKMAFGGWDSNSKMRYITILMISWYFLIVFYTCLVTTIRVEVRQSQLNKYNYDTYSHD